MHLQHHRHRHRHPPPNQQCTQTVAPTKCRCWGCGMPPVGIMVVLAVVVAETEQQHSLLHLHRHQHLHLPNRCHRRPIPPLPTTRAETERTKVGSDWTQHRACFHAAAQLQRTMRMYPHTRLPILTLNPCPTLRLVRVTKTKTSMVQAVLRKLGRMAVLMN